MLRKRRITAVSRDNEETGLTPRAALIGALFILLGAFIWLEIVFNGVWGGLGMRIYWVYYDGYAPNNHSLLPVFFIALIINPILKRFGSNYGFTNKEILTINNMVQFGVLIVGSGFFQRYIPAGMMGLSLHALQDPYLYGDIAARFQNVFFVDINEIIRWSLEGPGPVPWSQWIIPFISWSLLMFSIIGILLCFGTFIRRRWTDVEHLRYPIGVLKLAYIRGAVEGEKEGSLWKNKLIWVGIIIAFIFSGGSYFHTIWSWFPDTDMNLIRQFRNNLFSRNPDLQTAFHLYTTIHPMVMGSMWFVMSSELLFSIWFSYIIRSLLCFIFVRGSSMGLNVGNTLAISDVLLHSSIGACLALAISYIWLARFDIKNVVRKALSLSGSDMIDDSMEPLSYKGAFWGLMVFSFIFIVFCVVVLQMSLVLSFISFLLLIFFAVALARIRDEAGLGQQLGIGGWPIRSSFMPLVGAETIGFKNAGFGALNNLFSRPIMGFIGGFLESWKLGDELGEKPRNVTRSIILSIILATSVAGLIYIPFMYKLGFEETLSNNIDNALRWASSAASLKMEMPNRDSTVLFWYIYSFISVFILGWVRSVFIWWPLHPVGFAVGATIIGQWFVDMAFIIWLIKALVMRYRGYQGYKKATPIFLGLGIGQLLAGIVGLALGTLQVMRII